jgi:hypothetical protein
MSRERSALDLICIGRPVECGPHSDPAESHGLEMMLVEVRIEDLGRRRASGGDA